MKRGRSRLSPEKGAATAPSFLEVGRVVSAHGVAGKIKVAPYSGNPAGILKARKLCLGGPPGEGGAGVREYDVKTAQR